MLERKTEKIASGNSKCFLFERDNQVSQKLLVYHLLRFMFTYGQLMLQRKECQKERGEREASVNSKCFLFERDNQISKKCLHIIFFIYCFCSFNVTLKDKER
jgi:hypothetical protein